jgi:hypothetical protein
MKELLIKLVNVENDDKNYKTYRSATQQKINSSNTAWYINNKFRTNDSKKIKTILNFLMKNKMKQRKKLKWGKTLSIN